MQHIYLRRAERPPPDSVTWLPPTCAPVYTHPTVVSQYSACNSRFALSAAFRARPQHEASRSVRLPLSVRGWLTPHRRPGPEAYQNLIEASALTPRAGKEKTLHTVASSGGLVRSIGSKAWETGGEQKGREDESTGTTS